MRGTGDAAWVIAGLERAPNVANGKSSEIFGMFEYIEIGCGGASAFTSEVGS